MTQLLIDMGNSRLKWAVQTDAQLATQHSENYPAQLAALPAQLQQAWQTLSPPHQVWLASVAAVDKTAGLIEFVTDYWQSDVILVNTTAHACGVYNGYLQAEQLGVDRWLALIAAHQLVTTAACVVDCGTAVTLDVIERDGQHQGGLIMPGIVPMRQALASDTHALAALMQMQLQHDKPQLLAQDTRMGIQVGTDYAIVGLIESIMTRLLQQDKTVTLLITGGAANDLLPLLQLPYQYIPDLVIQGLGILAKQQKL